MSRQPCARRVLWRWFQRSWRTSPVAVAGVAASLAAEVFFGPRPFGEHAEEAGDVVHDLAGVLVGEVAPDARLPDLPGAGDLLARSLSFAASGRSIEDLTVGFLPSRAPGLRSRNPTDDAGPK